MVNHSWENGAYIKKIGGSSKTKYYEMALLWILNLSDGQNSLLDIAIKSGLKFSMICEAANDLIKVSLLKEIDFGV